jgi:AcrR family transcriptional regulator
MMMRSSVPAATNRSAPGLRERKKAQTRAAIQAAALRLFREHGYEATTVDQIIAAADVSESTFFRYFPTKEDVVFEDDFDPLLVAAYKAQPADFPPVRAMRAAFQEAFSGLSAQEKAEQRDRTALILSVPALRSAMLDRFSQAMRVLSEAVAERAGRRPDDFAVRTVAGAVVGAMMAVIAAMTDDPGADLAGLVDEAIAHLESGLSL